MLVQGWRRLEFMRNRWSVPVDDELPGWLELTKGHPYQKWLASYNLNPNLPLQKKREFFGEFQVAEIGTNSFRLAWDLYQAGVRPNEDVNLRMWAQSHPVEWEFRRSRSITTFLISNSESAEFAFALYRNDPESPEARAAMIHFNWGSVRELVDEWVRPDDSHPSIHLALGTRYMESKQFEKAQSHMRRAADWSPDHNTYRQLALAYKKANDDENWRLTLEEYLRVGAPGLAKDQFRVALAEYYLDKNEIEAARHYAEEAAQSWAGWAMQCAARCAEADEDWARAELWISRVSQRYPDAFCDWFFWCLRTGKGDHRKAYELVQEYFKANDKPDANYDPRWFAMAELAYRKPGVGCDYLANHVKRGKHLDKYAALTLATLAHIEDREKERKLGFDVYRQRRLRRDEDRQADEFLMNAFAKSAENSEPLDISIIDRYVAGTKDQNGAWVYLLTSLWLQKEGRQDEAKACLKKLTDTQHVRSYFGSVAAHFLREWDRVD